MSTAASPDGVGALVGRAAALCDLQRWPQAAQAAERALAASPEEPEAWCLLAQARLGADDVQGCLVAAGRAAAAGPDLEWPHRIASLALQRSGRRAEAVAAAREAVRCAPHVWQTHLRLAHAATDADERRAAVRQALVLAPQVAAVHVAAGAAAREEGRKDEAQAALRRALAIDPQLSEAHNELARVSLRGRAARPSLTSSRRLAAAATGFSRAVSTDPYAEVSRDDLELVLRALVGRVFRVLLVAGVLGVNVVRSSGGLAGRLVPVVALVVVALYAWTLLRRPPVEVRAHVVRMVRRRHLVTTVLAAAAGAALLACAVVPRSDVVGTASTGYALAFCALLGFRLETSRAGRAARRRS